MNSQSIRVLLPCVPEAYKVMISRPNSSYLQHTYPDQVCTDILVVRDRWSRSLADTSENEYTRPCSQSQVNL